MKIMTQTLPVATNVYKINWTIRPPFCTQSGQGGRQKKNLSHLAPVLYLTILRQQVTIKCARFWQPPFANICQLIGCFTMNLNSFSQGLLSHLHSVLQQTYIIFEEENSYWARGMSTR